MVKPRPLAEGDRLLYSGALTSTETKTVAVTAESLAPLASDGVV